MTEFMKPSFSVHCSGDQEYRDRWEATFGKKQRTSEAQPFDAHDYTDGDVKDGAHCGRDPAPVGCCGGTDATCSCECNTCQDPNEPPRCAGNADDLPYEMPESFRKLRDWADKNPGHPVFGPTPKARLTKEDWNDVANGRDTSEVPPACPSCKGKGNDAWYVCNECSGTGKREAGPRCTCTHLAAAHAVDGEERRECGVCDCREYEDAPCTGDARPCAHEDTIAVRYESISSGGHFTCAKWCVSCGALRRDEDQPYPRTEDVWRLPERRSEAARPEHDWKAIAEALMLAKETGEELVAVRRRFGLDSADVQPTESVWIRFNPSGSADVWREYPGALARLRGPYIRTLGAQEAESRRERDQPCKQPSPSSESSAPSPPSATASSSGTKAGPNAGKHHPKCPTGRMPAGYCNDCAHLFATPTPSVTFVCGRCKGTGGYGGTCTWCHGDGKVAEERYALPAAPSSCKAKGPRDKSPEPFLTDSVVERTRTED